jgi:peptide/nickel transport system permease protein
MSAVGHAGGAMRPMVEPGGGVEGEMVVAEPPRHRRRWTLGTSGAVLVALYAIAIAAPWVALYPPNRQHRDAPNAPPMLLRVNPPARWVGESVLYVHPQRLVDSLRRRYEVDVSRRIPLLFGARGHLLAPREADAEVFLVGSDALGRDLFSRLIYGSRVSLAVGLIGVLISTVVGMGVGVVAGYAGGRTDDVLMRLCEVMMALPAFYFLLALSAVIPPGLSPAQTFLLVVALMSFIRWAGFARVVRGIVAGVRELEYVQAARALGASSPRILLRHVVPAASGYAIVASTLAIPGFILGESALSLLGLGIQEPSTSWGSLLSDAQNLTNLDRYPWILAPGVLIAVTTMAFNFVGDRLRDRLDPRGARSA